MLDAAELGGPAPAQPVTDNVSLTLRAVQSAFSRGRRWRALLMLEAV